MAGRVGSDNIGDEGENPISEINVTPFVDVVLVLLVIFIVTAPTLMKDVIAVQLPKSTSSDEKVMQTLGIAVTKQGSILLNGVPTDQAGIAAEAKKVLDVSADAQAVISADTEAKHGDVVRAIDWIKEAGINRFALQIERGEGGASATGAGAATN